MQSEAVKQEKLILPTPEEEYIKGVSLAHRKKYAQFFTPEVIAQLMCRWLLEATSLSTILEPAVGLGIFSRILLSQNPDVNITGYDIDHSILNKTKKLFNHNNIKLTAQNYVFSDWDAKYDGIICNPPYFKFHDYDNKTVLQEFRVRRGYELTGFTNLYSLFLLKSAYQLNPGGRAAYIVPSEFLNSDYGKQIKKYLLKSNTLRHVLVIDFKENVFEDALTTASVILLANDGNQESIKFSNIKSLKNLDDFQASITKYPIFEGDNVHKASSLDPTIKWRAYYEDQQALKFSNLVSFSKYGKVLRGIATGANDYFVFNTSKAKKHQITENFLLPCITRSMDVKNTFFTNEDLTLLEEDDRNIYLFNALDGNNSSVAEYLKKGVARGIDKKYLTASRRPWYSLENRPPAPIWVGVFNRNGIRFVRNLAGIRNLTTFHSIYINKEFESLTELIFAYLLTNTARQLLEDNRREYGNGLQKFEPNDINKGKMLDLELIDKATQEQILELLRQCRQASTNKIATEPILLEIDKVFRESFL